MTYRNLPAKDQRSRNQVIALAALLQAAWLVDEMARNGKADSAATEVLFGSLFAFDATDTVGIYSSLPALRAGLGVLHDALRGQYNSPHYRNIMRYAMNLIMIEKEFRRQPDMQKIIRNRLSHAAFHRDNFANEITSVSRTLAGIYQDTLSTFKLRIQVTGSYEHLQNTQVAERIRALLLAGMRAAWEWRETGGKRWDFLLGRARLLKSCEQLLAALDSTDSFSLKH
jgi:high frequency lysogenization protein